MNTIDAFKKIIKNSDFHAKTALPHAQISRYRRWAEGNIKSENTRRPSEEQMENLLLKYGCKIVQQKIWSL